MRPPWPHFRTNGPYVYTKILKKEKEREREKVKIKDTKKVA